MIRDGGIGVGFEEIILCLALPTEQLDLTVPPAGTLLNRNVPRMYALFFHRLSILERATDHKCIKECSYSKKKCG